MGNISFRNNQKEASMEKNKDIKSLSAKKPNIEDWTNCKSTAQMLQKARVDQVETAFDRAAGM